MEEIEQGKSARLPPQGSPQVIVLPPVLYIGTLLLGLLAHVLLPVRPLAPLLARICGLVLLLVSSALGKWGESTMRRGGTNVRPDRPTTAIVSSGPFRFTRNPLYLASTGLSVFPISSAPQSPVDSKSGVPAIPAGPGAGNVPLVGTK
jgi:hypothetical protein